MPSSLSTGKQLEYLGMIRQFGDGRVAPRVAFALLLRQPQLTPYVPVQVLGAGFRQLHRQPVVKICLGVIVLGLEFVKTFGGASSQP